VPTPSRKVPCAMNGAPASKVEHGDNLPLKPTKTGKRAGRRQEGDPTIGAKSPRGAESRRRSRTGRGRRRLGWLGRSIAVCVLVVLGLVAWAAVARARAPMSNTDLAHFDVLIVLGSPADEDGNPTLPELERVTEAVHEYERGVAPRIIFTGGAAHNRFVEARVMARTAEAQGIPEPAIFIEPEARDTIENACYSVRMMRSHGWRSAEVVSSPGHLPRAGMIFSRLPVEWRMHAAPPLGRPRMAPTAAGAIFNVLSMVHYLAWSRQVEPCHL
jgi:uncharacterized SAM-binding protein YcdF (DUF218 family)